MNQENQQKRQEFIVISQKGFQKLKSIYQETDPQKNFIWATDYKLEMPIFFDRTITMPKTLITYFMETCARNGNGPAFSYIKNGIWQTETFNQYYDQCLSFGNACISLQLTKKKSVNIIGFNSPQWAISFYGAMFANYLPVGIYTTNTPEACQYVAENSECELVVVEDKIQLDKFLQIWENLPQLKYVVIYNEPKPSNLPTKYMVFDWSEFMNLGKTFKPTKQDDDIKSRMVSQKPGDACTLVYTSGTTGQPKGVILCHDNYTYPAEEMMKRYKLKDPNPRMLSFLPLSHVAAQLTDLVSPVCRGMHLYFTDITALQGKLVDFLKQARPSVFLGVPRVWEKIYDKIQDTLKNSPALKLKIFKWAQSKGIEGTFDELQNRKLSFGYKLAKKIVYNKLKAQMGLDKCEYFVFGAAPLSPQIRKFFLELNILITPGYGMSESAGIITFGDLHKYKELDQNFFKQTGFVVDGMDVKIEDQDVEGNGEITFRGRGNFLGYFKNEEETRKTINNNGYIKSGDIGKIVKDQLIITGRSKELLITAGGENVAPVLIENEIKNALPIVSQSMVIGDKQKYLVVLLTLKHEFDSQTLQFKSNLAPEVVDAMAVIGVQASTAKDVKSNKTAVQFIQDGIDKANLKAISQAQHIRKWAILEGEFSIEGGEMTPTLKLKRNVAAKKYEEEINRLYQDSKL